MLDDGILVKKMDRLRLTMSGGRASSGAASSAPDLPILFHVVYMLKGSSMHLSIHVYPYRTTHACAAASVHVSRVPLSRSLDALSATRSTPRRVSALAGTEGMRIGGSEGGPGTGGARATTEIDAKSLGALAAMGSVERMTGLGASIDARRRSWASQADSVAT